MQINLIQCDGCGKELRTNRTYRVLELRDDIVLGPDCGYPTPIMENACHFCDFQCLAVWVTLRASETVVESGV